MSAYHCIHCAMYRLFCFLVLIVNPISSVHAGLQGQEARIAEIMEVQEIILGKKKKTKKVQIIDEVTELKDDPGACSCRGLGDFKDPDVSEITTEVSFSLKLSFHRLTLFLSATIPATLCHSNAASGNLCWSTCILHANNYNCRRHILLCWPPGTAPELCHLFMFPVHDHWRLHKSSH